jgi:hypothetical protein
MSIILFGGQLMSISAIYPNPVMIIVSIPSFGVPMRKIN